MSEATAALASRIESRAFDPELSTLFLRAVHDLNGPLSTLGLQLFSLGRSLESLRDAGPQGARQASTDTLPKLESSWREMGEALALAITRVQKLEEAGRELGIRPGGLVEGGER